MNSERQPEPVDAGQVEQFMALYASHKRRLYLYTLTLLPTSFDAEDVLQDANLVLWRKFGQFRPNTNFFAWACSVIRFEVLKYREKHARAAALLDPDVLDRLAETAVDQLEHLDEFHRQGLVDCMAKLSEGDRELMRQRYTVGMAVQAIAAALNRSANAVSKSLGRVRRTLLDCINRSVEDQQDGAEGTALIGQNGPKGDSQPGEQSPRLSDGDCPNFCVSKNGTVPFAAENVLSVLADTKIADTKIADTKIADTKLADTKILTGPSDDQNPQGGQP